MHQPDVCRPSPRALRRGRAVAGLAAMVATLATGRALAAQTLDPWEAQLVVEMGRRRAPAAGDGAARPFAAFSGSAQRLRDSLVVLARAQVGRRYRLGGQSPEQGFDCSGLVRYLMAALEVDLPRTAAQQSRQGRPVERDPGQLRPGDLLTFGTGKRVSHIGIYVGDGRFVHASSVAGRVVESAVERKRAPLIKPWAGARRVLADADSTAR